MSQLLEKAIILRFLSVIMLVIPFNTSVFGKTYAIKFKEYGSVDLTVKFKEYGSADETWRVKGACERASSYTSVKGKEYGSADLTIKIKTYGSADKDICIKNPDDLPDWFRKFLLN